MKNKTKQPILDLLEKKTSTDVVVKPSSYQPNVQELKQDLRLDVPFETALGQLVKSVNVKVEGKDRGKAEGEE